MLRVVGELDVGGAQLLLAQLPAALGEEPAGPSPSMLVVDLAETTFLDSLGVGALLAAREQAERSGVAFALREVGPRCRRVLEVTRLTDVFTIL